MLRKLAEVAEGKRTEANRESQVRHQRRITFLRQAEPADTSNSTPAPKLLAPGLEWKTEVDLGRQLYFPEEICGTILRPDLVQWSSAGKTVLLVELMVPWEEGM